MKFQIIALTLFFTSCARLETELAKWKTQPALTAPIVAQKAKEPDLKDVERVVKYEFSTRVSAERAFNQSKKWLAKNLNDSNHAVKMENDKTNEIISKAITSCGENNKRGVDLELEIGFKNNKARIIIENIKTTDPVYDPKDDKLIYYPATRSEFENFKSNCLDSMIEDLKKAIAQNNDW